MATKKEMVVEAEALAAKLGLEIDLSENQTAAELKTTLKSLKKATAEAEVEVEAEAVYVVTEGRSLAGTLKGLVGPGTPLSLKDLNNNEKLFKGLIEKKFLVLRK